jgi:hypothetical protein
VNATRGQAEDELGVFLAVAGGQRQRRREVVGVGAGEQLDQAEPGEFLLAGAGGRAGAVEVAAPCPGVWVGQEEAGAAPFGCVEPGLADGAGTAKVRRSARAIRANGALARDAPSLPGRPPARRGPCLRRDHGRALVRPGCSKPITSSAASTATCTCRNSAPRSKTTSSLSVPRARMRTSKRHDDHRGPPPKFYGTRDNLCVGDRPRRPPGAVSGAAWCPGG